MRLYLKHSNWSNDFMEKVAIKLELTPSQVYKWCWDRNEQEHKQKMFLIETGEMPDRIWYVTQVVKHKKSKKMRSRRNMNKF